MIFFIDHKKGNKQILFMQTKIKILLFGNDYLGGQFLQEIMENHYDKFEVVGLSTNLNNPKISFTKKIKKVITK